MHDGDVSDEEVEDIESVWNELGTKWAQEGKVVPMRDMTTHADKRAEHLSRQPLNHEESVVLLSSLFQARAQGRDADIPTLLGYFNDPASFRKILWDASRRGRNT